MARLAALSIPCCSSGVFCSQDECRQIRPLPPHLDATLPEEAFHFPSSALWHDTQAAAGAEELTAEVDDEILDLARCCAGGVAWVAG